MSLLEQLTSDDDLTRLLAAEEAARTGGPELVDVLLDLALHDAAEVQITGGVAERWENVSDAAATGLGAVLARQGGLDDRVRHAVCDPTTTTSAPRSAATCRARLAHLFTARQIRAGLDPLPPGRFSAMLTRGRT